MLSTPAEQARRLNSEVPDLLLVSIDDGNPVLLQYRFVLLLQRELFVLRTVAVLLRLLLEVRLHVAEVALVQVVDDLALLLRHNLAPILEEVVVERDLAGVLVIQQARVKSGDLLRILRQLHLLPVVVKRDSVRQRLVRRSKHWTFVLEECPLGAVVLLLFFPPRTRNHSTGCSPMVPMVQLTTSKLPARLRLSSSCDLSSGFPARS